MSRDDKERRRAEIVAHVPDWYRPWLHLAIPSIIGAVVAGAALSRLHALSALDLLAVPVTLFASFGFEWRVHKYVLHRRFWPFEVIYDKHTPMHHMIYVEGDMALRSAKEVRLVAIPAAGVLGIVIATTPFALLVSYLWSRPAGWLFLLTAAFTLVSYELLHLSYHAPKTSAMRAMNGAFSKKTRRMA